MENDGIWPSQGGSGLEMTVGPTPWRNSQGQEPLWNPLNTTFLGDRPRGRFQEMLGEQLLEDHVFVVIRDLGSIEALPCSSDAPGMRKLLRRA